MSMQTVQGLVTSRAPRGTAAAKKERKRVRTGWSNKGHYEHPLLQEVIPARQGCRWTPREDLDLLLARRKGASLAQLAHRHQRALSAIDMRLGEKEIFLGRNGQRMPTRAEEGAAKFLAEAMQQDALRQAAGT